MNNNELESRIITEAHEWMLDNLNFAYIVVDCDFNYLESNSAAADIFEELKSIKRNERVPEEVVQFILAEKNRIKLGEKILEKSVSSINVDLWLSGYCVAIYDVTKRQKFIQSLLSEVSYEIRTPMNVIMGMLDVCAREVDSESIKENIEVIKNAGRGLVTVASEVLNAASDSVDNDEEKTATEDITLIEASDRNFSAPAATMLLVEDDAINTKVALRLLKPIGAKIETAKNGMEAIEMVKNNHYDIVLMDYLMPEMDGVEATKTIRAMGSEFSSLPIIALSANVMPEAKKEFLEAGMDDVIEKPMEIDSAKKIIRKWLSASLIIEDDSYVPGDEEVVIEAEGIDIKEALKNCGSSKLLLELLRDFAGLVPNKSKKLSSLLSQEKVKDYTIEVHALKNNARMIGAIELSQMFADAEKTGSEGDIEKLRMMNPGLLREYARYKDLLSGFATANMTGKALSDSDLIKLLNQIKKGIQKFELDEIDAALDEISSSVVDYKYMSLIDKLRLDVADVNLEEIEKTVDLLVASVYGEN